MLSTKKGKRGRVFTLSFLFIISIFTLVQLVWAMVQFSVQPTAETEPPTSGGAGDISDDPAIWIHPNDPAQSTIIGTDKSSSGGLNVYRLDGTLIEFLQDGQMNGVDIRYRFPLDEELVDLVVATRITNTTSGRLEIYSVNQTTGQLTNVTGATQISGYEPYGLTLYHSHQTGKFYAFVSTESGPHKIEQFELRDNGSGRIDAISVRSIDNVTRSEGMTADDVAGNLFVGVEARGIFKFDAEPSGGVVSTTVDLVNGANGFPPDVEGISLYHAGSTEGYLLASSQNVSGGIYLYQRQAPHQFVTSFEVTENTAAGIDEVRLTDGVDVTNINLGADFSQGLMVVHDNFNGIGVPSNFKLVPWQNIATAAMPSTTLAIDTSWNVRSSPLISISDTSLVEGDSGSTTAIFRINLSHPLNNPLTVTYATSADTAASPDDFTAVSEILTIAAGETEATILIPVKGDTETEGDETFLVTLSNPSLGTLSRAAAEGTIVDDDQTEFSIFIPLVVRQ